jgi:beta-glucosidase
VTLYHWDLPVALEFELDGWLGDKISDVFAAYADICFKSFGDRVKKLDYINESWVVAILGYGLGVFAPGKKSMDYPYLAGHNLIKAHAKAVDIYRKKYQSTQQAGSVSPIIVIGENLYLTAPKIWLRQNER